MLTVTESAQKQIEAYFDGQEKQPIRIFLVQGCGGPQIGMGLDGKKVTDVVYEVGDVEYLVDKELLKQAQPIQVDWAQTGFRITSSLELGSGCSSCGASGSCCS